MGDLFSFVSACGADDFSLRPLCDVDRLIFAQLSYCDFLPAMPFAPCPLKSNQGAVKPPPVIDFYQSRKQFCA